MAGSILEIDSKEVGAMAQLVVIAVLAQDPEFESSALVNHWAWGQHLYSKSQKTWRAIAERHLALISGL